MNWTEDEIYHIEATADDYGVDYNTAYVIANLLGKEELYDGFVCAIQDAEVYL